MRTLQQRIIEKLLINKNFKNINGLCPDDVTKMFEGKFDSPVFINKFWRYRIKQHICHNDFKNIFYELVEMIEKNCSKKKNIFILNNHGNYFTKKNVNAGKNECIIISEKTTNEPTAIWFFNEENKEYMIFAVGNDSILIKDLNESLSLMTPHKEITSYELNFDIIHLFKSTI